MKIHIITIFPEMFDSYFKTSIMGRAIDKGLLELELYKLNDFSDKKTKRVDDKAYGMHGQVICAEPLSKAIEFVFGKVGKKIPVIYMSPSGEIITQEKVESYSEKLGDEIIIICGHYEGIDQRIIELYVDYEISIGEYIISSGELASMVFIDSLVRILPGVIGNNLSHEEESFSKKLDRKKEYPLYTKPEIFAGLNVPSVLLSGNHKEIENWKTTNLKS